MVTMPSPQKEDGYLAVANELAEAFARASLSDAQWRLVWVVLRQTYGWGRKVDRISVAQFVESTGLHRTLVARELGRLAARHILIEWGDDHHPKTYGVQKDYGRWVGKVSTESLTHAPEVSTESLQSVNDSATKVSTESLTTKDTKDKKATTEANASGSLRDRYAAKYRESSNKTAVYGELFSFLFGAAPDFRRLGGMAKRLKSGGRMIDALLEASRHSITDDPHDYLEKMVQRLERQGGEREVDRRPGAGRAGAARHFAVGAADYWADAEPEGYDSWRDGPQPESPRR
jgi:phage replication O-like protein O